MGPMPYHVSHDSLVVCRLVLVSLQNRPVEGLALWGFEHPHRSP